MHHTRFEDVTESGALLGPVPVWNTQRRFAAWSHGPSLLGWLLWGHVDDADADALRRLWHELAGRSPEYDFVLDVRALDGLSQGAFDRLREFGARSERGLRKMAIVVDQDTTASAMQVGVFVLRPPAFAWRSCASYEQVAVWLARPQVAAALAAVHERAVESAAQVAPLLAVRRRLRCDPAASLAELARQLGMSTRTLQRTLSEAGTTLSLERDRLRGERVSELLRDPEAKLDAIAAEIGCADRRSLNRLFRRVTGESPAQFRARLAGARRALSSGSPIAAGNAHTSARSA